MNEELVAEVVRRVLAEIERRPEPPAPAPAAGAVFPAAWPPKRVAVGADHGGFDLKEDIARFLRAKKYEVVDCGTRSTESVDYPDFAAAVARQVARGQCEAGIMIDGAGIGSGMAANRIPGVRCAVCHDLATIRNSREHNDANVLSLGSKVVTPALARRMVAVWLQTECTGERHLRRVRKILELET